MNSKVQRVPFPLAELEKECVCLFRSQVPTFVTVAESRRYFRYVVSTKLEVNQIVDAMVLLCACDYFEDEDEKD